MDAKEYLKIYDNNHLSKSIVATIMEEYAELKLSEYKSQQQPPDIQTNEAFEDLADEKCSCAKCKPNVFPHDVRFIVCSICGNKRCPHAADHDNPCTNSNDEGQKGRLYDLADNYGLQK